MRIPLLGARDLTRLRYAAASAVDGVPTRPAAVESTLRASIHPAPKAVLERMPDGTDPNSVAVFLTYGEVREGVDGVYPDDIRVPSGLDVLDGDYEIQEISRNPEFQGLESSRYIVGVRK